jgi:hypothetical protein
MAKPEIPNRPHFRRTKPPISRLTGPKTAIRAQNIEQPFGTKIPFLGTKKPFESHFDHQEPGPTCTPARNRSPKVIAYEIAGHVLFSFLVRWIMVEAGRWAVGSTTRTGTPHLRLSFTQAIPELKHDMSRTPITASPQRVSRVLLPPLLIRIAEYVVRAARHRRHYPRPFDSKVRITGSGKRLSPGKLPTDQPQGSDTCKKVA